MRTRAASATTLFHVAAEEYGDATQWWRIARANAITDPIIGGTVVVLSIPEPRQDSEGDGIPFDD